MAAIDRAAVPRPVVLAFAPAALVEEAGRLAAVLRDVEAAGRLRHPAVVSVLGAETHDDALALVEEWRPGVTLRELLDAGGRLPADVAARIAVDVCAGLEAAHGIEVDAGKRLTHGEIDPARILVDEGGAAALAGFATAGRGEEAADVRALAAALHECLAGEPPGDPPRGLEEPGIPPALASVVNRALGAEPGGALDAVAFGAAIQGAGPVASRRAVASYAEAILPAGEGSRAALRAAVDLSLRGAEIAEVSAELVVDPSQPAIPRASAFRRPVDTAPLPRPPSTRPGVDPAGVFRAPQAVRARSPLPLVAGACALAGFVIGFAAVRIGLSATPPPAALEEPAPKADTSPPEIAPMPVPAAPERPRPKATAGAPRPAARSRAAPGPLAAPKAGGKGTVDVAAPADAEVFLDGKRIGRGSVRVDVAEGPHRIEVRRGADRVEEWFTVAPGETWTYEVTPAP